MKKVIIIGSKGMAGHMLYHYLKENTNLEVVDIARNAEFHTPSYQTDILDFDQLNKIFEIEKPTFVVNCIGILNQDAETHPDKAILINSYLPHFLAEVGNKIGFKLIHISTDCVFNGKKGGYLENSEKDGIGFYAKTKALGEIESEQHITLRTSIVGPELKSNGIGLFNWFMHQSGSIKCYTNAWWTGVTTLELAKAMCQAIEQDISGLHHLVNNEKINKCDLIRLFKSALGKKIELVPFGDYKVDKSLIKTDFTFNYSVPSYSQMILDMKDWIVEHKNLYKEIYDI